MIDCKGTYFVVPGFVDSHIHLLDGGYDLTSVQLRNVKVSPVLCWSFDINSIFRVFSLTFKKLNRQLKNSFLQYNNMQKDLLPEFGYEMVRFMKRNIQLFDWLILCTQTVCFCLDRKLEPWKLGVLQTDWNSSVWNEAINIFLCLVEYFQRMNGSTMWREIIQCGSVEWTDTCTNDHFITLTHYHTITLSHCEVLYFLSDHFSSIWRCLANALAMQLANVSSLTPDPPGGEIVRDT